ncbi:MAG: hypothetical protein COA78_28490 [Blastopirellula sp.]|nr:MAG: hypothetical protein COA78_28490 [Blastopirellula sp.]
MEQEELQVKAINDLRSHIHMNSMSLPTGFYRVDMLPFHDYVTSGDNILPLRPLTKEEKDAEDAKINHSERVSIRQDEPAADKEHVYTELDDELDDEEEIAFDPITKEPISYMDTTPIERVHPLIVFDDTVQADVEEDTGPYRIAGFVADDLQLAFVFLDYKQGYPTFENGDPFWSNLKFEPQDAFQAFQQYLYMTTSKRLATPFVDTSDEASEPVSSASGLRSIADLATTMERELVKLDSLKAQLQIWSQLYYWDWRAQAYDMFRVVEHRSQQELRAIETQDSHYIMARTLSEKAMNFINSEDFTELLTPKVALDMIRMSSNLERVSAGLSASGPGTNYVPPTVISAEMTLRQVANGSQTVDEIDMGDGSSLIIDGALANAEETGTLQALILRVQTGG